MKGIIGKKIGMTQVFLQQRNQLTPVTFIEIEPNLVIRQKTLAKEGYIASQLGTLKYDIKKMSKPLQGHLRKHKAFGVKVIREIRNMENIEGTEIGVSIFSPGEYVNIRSITKGKGFQGGVKRHGFKKGPMSHGSGVHRSIGSTGSIAANRVFKGKKMPGHMGFEKVTIRNLLVIAAEDNCLLIKGSIPGPKGSIAMIWEGRKKKEIIPPTLLSKLDSSVSDVKGETE